MKPLRIPRLPDIGKIIDKALDDAFGDFERDVNEMIADSVKNGATVTETTEVTKDGRTMTTVRIVKTTRIETKETP